MIAVVAGATGLSGQALIRELEQDSRFTEVHAWVRVSGKLPKLSKLREHVLPPGGFEELLKKPVDSFQGLNAPGAAFFCALGTTIKKAGSREAFRRVDFHEVAAFGKFCEKTNGQSLALVSAVGAATDSLIFYSRVKAEAEDAVQALAIPRVAIFRPSFLIGDRQESRPMERFFIQAWRRGAHLLPPTWKAKAGTPIEVLAKVMIEQAVLPGPGRVWIEAQDIRSK